ncbi:MAG: DUF669 domain-containing protein [Mitsuokella sp.]
MMKPNGFDTAPAIKGGGFPQLPPGGYICRIVEAKEQKSKSGRNMLVFGLDIAEGEYKDFYLKQFQRRHEENPDTKWPCLYYQLTDGDSVGRLKGLLMALEESNDGFILASWDWDEKRLKKLLCCGVFREEEYLNHENKVRTSVKCISILPTAELPNVKVPEKKTLEPQQQNNGGWGNIPDEDIPF